MRNLSLNFRKKCVTAMALVSAAMMPVAAMAEPVTLKSSDGTVNLVGEFVEFTDDNYVIRTALGDLRISASRVRCEGAACPRIETASADVTIAGSDTIGLGLMPLLMTGYAAAKNADAEITNTALAGQTLAKLIGDGGFGDEIGSYLVTASSSEDAFEALMAGDANIGMASRRIVPAEARELRDAGAGNMVSPDQEHVIAVDSLVIITHPSNPIEQISMDELRRVYSGQLTNWSELGGPDLPITVMSRNDTSATREFFDARVFNEQQLPEVPGQVTLFDDQEMAAMVNQEQGAIGYVGFAFQRGAKPLTLINECGIPTKPDEFSAKTEEYPLDRRMYLYNRGDNLDDAAKEFLEFAVSEAADGVVAKSGFIDLGIVKRSQDLTDSRALDLINTTADDFEAGVMREMLASMIRADRLSTTFRFRTGSSNMDEKARLDMQRLIRYMENAPEGAEITFVGFTDDVGAFEANRRLSVGRAQKVLQDIKAAANGRLDHVLMNTAGFGEIAPSACNASERGRSINRRVEVWMAKG